MITCKVIILGYLLWRGEVGNGRKTGDRWRKRSSFRMSDAMYLVPDTSFWANVQERDGRPVTEDVDVGC